MDLTEKPQDLDLNDKGGNSKELELLNDNQEKNKVEELATPTPKVEEFDQPLALEKSTEDLEKECKAIKCSYKFLVMVLCMSTSFSIAMVYKNNKKIIGINHYDDYTLTLLAIPTSLIIFTARLFGGHVMTRIG